MLRWRSAAAVMAVLVVWAGAYGAEPASSDATALEVFNEDVSVAPDGSFTTTSHSEMKALNEAGAMQASRVSVYYDSEMQSVEIVEAHTLKKDGTKVPVDISTIYEQLPSDNSLAVTSFRVKVLLFPQFAAGDTAVYTVRTIQAKPMFAGAFQYGKFFPRTETYKNATVTITAPKSLALKTENHDVSFSKSERGDTIVYRWQRTATGDRNAKTAMISPIDREPRFFVSSFKDYSELGRAYALQAEPKAAVTPKIHSLADDITKDVTNRREQARLIYEWVVKHIRYVAIELGRGSFVPHDADTVLARGYGDCKDHDTLLEALLKAKGIDAQGILINGSNGYTLSEAPSFSQLNHIITYLPEFDVYLDASMPVAAFGVLSESEYGKPAVRAARKGAGLITLPMPQPDAITIHQKTTQKVTPDGTLTGNTVTTATGTYAILLRYVGYAVQSVGPEKAGQLQMAARGFKDGKATLIPDSLTDLGDSFTIRGDFSAKGWETMLKGDATTMPGGLRLLPMTGDSLMGPLYGDDAIADEATLCLPAKADEDIALELPPGYAVRHMPDDETITTPNLTFTVHWSQSGNILAVHRAFTTTIDRPVCSGAVRKQAAAALKRIQHSYDETFDLIHSLEHYKTTAGTPKDADTLIDRGLAYQKAGDHEKAIADFTAAIALKPDNYWAHFQRAYSLTELGKTDEAIAEYTKTVALKDDPGAYGNRGRLYADQGKFDLAIADFDHALALEPDDYDIYNERGRSYRVTNQIDRAIADLTKSIALKPDYALSHYNLACLYSAQHHYDEALREFDKAIAIDPSYYYAYWDRAAAYQSQSKLELAAKDLDKALELEPKVAGLWADRAGINFMLGHNANGDADLAQAFALDPNLTRAWQIRAGLHMSKQQFALAADDFTTSLSKEPKNTWSYVGRASAYLSLNDLKRALADAEAAIAINPKLASAYLVRAQIRHAMGDHFGGNRDSAKAAELDPRLEQPAPPWRTTHVENSKDATANPASTMLQSDAQGALELKLGHYQTAIAAFQRAIKQGMPDRSVLPDLCVALSHTEQLAETVYQCSRALQYSENDNNPQVLRARLVAYFRQGKFKDALDDITTLSKVFPNEPELLYERGVVRKKLGDNKGGDADIAAATARAPGVANKIPAAMRS